MVIDLPCPNIIVILGQNSSFWPQVTYTSGPRLLTAIPEIKRSYWDTKIDEFYLIYIRSLKPK
jgi:hypothetical protein